MTLYSIGHSNIEVSAFLDLLLRYEIELLIDTRSQPYSRYSPQFSRDALRQALTQTHIEYVFMGDVLGGRPTGEEFYHRNGKADYEAMALSPFYLSGIAELLKLANDRRLAFMCSEADFKKCHRYNLITRTLVERSIAVSHILHSGEAMASHKYEFESDQLSLF